MGFFDKFLKEIYINQLAKAFSRLHDCDDMISIKVLRQNYTTDELKVILVHTKDAIRRNLPEFCRYPFTKAGEDRELVEKLKVK